MNDTTMLIVDAHPKHSSMPFMLEVFENGNYQHPDSPDWEDRKQPAGNWGYLLADLLGCYVHQITYEMDKPESVR